MQMNFEINELMLMQVTFFKMFSFRKCPNDAKTPYVS